ncbi:MAG: dUTP diphosphatase [Verrucomicrobia bacterium]|nr:dUTP diphosphatase [Verrucomicrobiota bacterium]MBS0645779.1 dUTP diphosphatase [Verrucomicrobiota bacterium]
MEEVEILVKTKGPVPVYATEQAAGADLCAALDHALQLQPGASICIPTGLCVEIPEGYELQIRPRSGLALKHQITVLNTPGTIDSDYRGEIGVILINHGQYPFIIEPGMRIAQAVLAAVCRARYIKVEALAISSRAEGGFGHTGLAAIQ